MECYVKHPRDLQGGWIKHIQIWHTFENLAVFEPSPFKVATGRGLPTERRPFLGVIGEGGGKQRIFEKIQERFVFRKWSSQHLRERMAKNPWSKKKVFVESANTEPMAVNEWNQYQVSFVNGM